VGRRRTAVETPLVDLAADKDPRASVAEAYRELRTSILLSNPGQPPRRIVVTSSLPEEGKTATATNLAIVLAQMGRRVLLVDTDLRRPRLHKTFPVENGAGVSTCLSGLESDPVALVQPTGVENLDLLPSGPIPPNPSELLNSPTFVEMGDRLLAERYDHIVFDSPPVLSVSDPVIIAHTAGTAILVVRAGSTTKQSIRLAVSKFHHSENTQMGVVLNDLDADAHGAPYYRYNYESRQDPTDTDKRDHGNRALS
jgi:capsular exopolysaccharide synthesis family protein